MQISIISCILPVRFIYHQPTKGSSGMQGFSFQTELKTLKKGEWVEKSQKYIDFNFLSIFLLFGCSVLQVVKIAVCWHERRTLGLIR